MFVIRTAQLEALGKARAATFERQAAERLKKKHPEKCKALGDDGVREWVTKAMQKRLEHRFDDEQCVLQYLDLMVLHGPDFDALPWAKETLDDPDLSARVRFALLMERAHAKHA